MKNLTVDQLKDLIKQYSDQNRIKIKYKSKNKTELLNIIHNYKISSLTGGKKYISKKAGYIAKMLQTNKNAIQLTQINKPSNYLLDLFKNQRRDTVSIRFLKVFVFNTLPTLTRALGEMGFTDKLDDTDLGVRKQIFKFIKTESQLRKFIEIIKTYNKGQTEYANLDDPYKDFDSILQASEISKRPAIINHIKDSIDNEISNTTVNTKTRMLTTTRLMVIFYTMLKMRYDKHIDRSSRKNILKQASDFIQTDKQLQEFSNKSYIYGRSYHHFIRMKEMLDKLKKKIKQKSITDSDKEKYKIYTKKLDFYIKKLFSIYRDISTDAEIYQKKWKDPGENNITESWFKESIIQQGNPFIDKVYDETTLTADDIHVFNDIFKYLDEYTN